VPQDSISKNAIADTAADALQKKSKEELIGIAQKLYMAYALSQRSADVMRTQYNDKLKNCGNKAENAAGAKEPSDKAVKEEEKKIERESAKSPAEDTQTGKETPEQKKEEKQFDKELKDVEKSAGVQY